MNDEQLMRYSRHILLPQMDIGGQQALIDSHVLIVGLGGLGSPVALYLAASGVGTLTLVDDDQVELSNLQRQIIHTESSIGQSKVDSAAERIHTVNSEVKTNSITERLDKQRLLSMAERFDVIVDCSDNFATRFLLNEVSQESNTPLVSSAAIRFEAQVSVYDPRVEHSPCYHCLYDDMTELDQSCVENGVIAPMLGIIGSIQAMETIKLLSRCGDTLVGRLLVLDATSMQFQEIKLKKDERCPVCGGS